MVNILDDCEKLEHVTNLHEHYDVVVSIKVQEFRSHHAKFVYHDCSHVLSPLKPGHFFTSHKSQVTCSHVTVALTKVRFPHSSIH